MDAFRDQVCLLQAVQRQLYGRSSTRLTRRLRAWVFRPGQPTPDTVCAFLYRAMNNLRYKPFTHSSMPGAADSVLIGALPL